MIKFSAGIAYEQNRPMGVASALIAHFFFFCEKCIKNALYNNFLHIEVVTNHNTQLLVQIFFFHRSTGLASALTAEFDFLMKSALQMCCTKKFYKKKNVVANEKPQLLCYVIFFDSLRHFGVIAASQIIYVV